VGFRRVLHPPPPVLARARCRAPWMGEQRARVAAGHLFLWLSRLSETTRAAVCECSRLPLPGRGLTSELVVAALAWGG
jgi:hypothetical protein